MRKVITISMPWEMHEELLRRVSRTSCESVSEYIRELIQRDNFSKRKPVRSAEQPDRPEVQPAQFEIMTFNEAVKKAIDSTLARKGPNDL